MTPNKELQEARMKGYFIQATKEIIKSEGIKAVSVRNIASQAGYSYATLYNYFRDAKDLIFECVKDFQAECLSYILERIQGVSPGRARLEGFYEAYAQYCLEYPGIFELFYIEKLSDISMNPDLPQMIACFGRQECATDWALMMNENALNQEQIEMLMNRANVTVAGLLVLFLNRRYPGDYAEFKKSLRQQIHWCFQAKG